VIKATEARKTILKEGKEGGKNDYINIENVGNTSLHVVVVQRHFQKKLACCYLYSHLQRYFCLLP
jgi:hypothetical protein